MTDGSAISRHYLLYDFMQVAGGAERVTLTLAEAFPEFRTVVSRCYPQADPLLKASSARVHELRGGWSAWLPRILESMWCFRVRARCLRDAETVVYSGFYAPLAVHHQRQGRRIYYCHTVPRFAYDLYESTLAGFPAPLRPLYALFVRWFRWQYESALGRMDCVLVNSNNVRQRLRHYIGRDAEVVYPPVAVEHFQPMADGGYYLSTARLVANKRVDVVVQAFLTMPERRLVVLSGGPETARLQALAAGAPNIVFAGWQSDTALRRWVGGARAVIYLPVDEDFGMSPVEAMAAGKPVIGVAEGGLLETVLPGETGVLMGSPPTPLALVQAVAEAEALIAAKGYRLQAACVSRAEHFSEARFIERMRDILR
ncbi:glycosyltransferase [Paracidovorax citrulli]|uniref:Glycosyl transferase, group 1 n=2 Tax=Paracidovorax citrulli TaxID=80869 RepID=A1TKS3_PARC0|nr:glycosyltransferase [Paracidovorax citrulli]ABM31561.1 glycosyl transferase, group 1 [Paracidovorax citrulli AAC00-1]ATG95347.1 glycosyltransferase family 4 protein [Paracidovorax citrulli]PVY65746.1 glycosyltransferase involved in cell wall biosynthesis [Paracidovorax citrulli]REG70081.1 glycosyltransferase involved in cell wall biosynthesis [Paracidovorax citrulli]RLJ94633.1 glycosyltransferase involved in cell wall biosynthesis [Paracidovorax citrulli]